ncbi:MAG: chemotaxis protein CheA, partial [Deltaproteobacteria bacterium]
PRRRREDAERTVRIRTELLDRLIRLTGELMTTRTGLVGAWKEGREQVLAAGLDQLSLQVDELHYRVLQARMMPLATITGRLPRLVRDHARKTGKKIELRIIGEEVELDRAIIEELSDPLVHLLRNAVDHGIEREGVIEVRAWREKDLVLVEVADNGRGIDVEKIRRRALERGLADADRLAAMGERELFALLCRPGFSTAERVSETSGRGVGMDVVKAAVDGLGGDLEILSAPGEGTRILLRLPLSVAIIKILLVEVGGMPLALPITRVIRTLEVERGQLQSSGRQLVLRLEDEVVPLLSMRKMLRLPPGNSGETVPLVLVELQGRRAGLVVDRLLTQEEAFVQGLEFPLDRLPGLAGVTLLGDGRVVFVLDPSGLAVARRQARGGTK